MVTTYDGQVDVVLGQLELISPSYLSESVPILNSKSISTQIIWLVYNMLKLYDVTVAVPFGVTVIYMLH